MSALAPTLQAFFTERLIGQRQASPNTIAAYRDALRLLVTYVADRTGKSPVMLDFSDLDAQMIGDFLVHLEEERGASVTTRNARLAAVHSLFGFAAFRHPEHAELIARVLSIQAKRGTRALVSFLTRPETEALLNAPDRSKATGRRDYVLLALDLQSGLRVSELTGLRRKDVMLDEEGVTAKFGVAPPSIPDYLALVGDSADGFPGLAGWGAKSAATVLARWHHIEDIPPDHGDWDVTVRGAAKLATTLQEGQQEARLFKELATLRIDRSLLGHVEELRWQGPTDEFADLCAAMDAPGIARRAEALAASR